MEFLRSFEYGLSPAAFLMVLLYYIYLWRKTRIDPMSTTHGMARHARELWVAAVVRAGKDILAVQTLRNWTMATTFLASAAIIIGLGVFNLALTADKQGELSLLMGPLSSRQPELWTAKLILLGADFLFAFFNFTLAVRYLIHTAFMINLPAEGAADIGIEDVAAILNRGGNHYTMGMRGFYLSVPLALWLFGPLWMFAGTVLTVAALYRIDRGV